MKRLNYVMMLGILLVLLCPMVLSQTIENLGTFQQYTNVQLKQVCSNCTWVNITTVSYPNSTYGLNTETPMVEIANNNFYYIYNLTDAIGEYTYCGHGDVSGVDTPFCVTFHITPTGESGDSSLLGFYIMLTIIILGILTFGILLHHLEITLIGGLITLAWGTYTAFYGFGTYKNGGTEILSVGILAFGLFWVALAGLEYIKESSGEP